MKLLLQFTKHNLIFNHRFLDAQYVEYCNRFGNQVLYPIGSIIFKEGEQSSEVYYIKQGDIEQSINASKKIKQEASKIKEIKIDLTSSPNNIEEDDGFEAEKFLKSDLFYANLYEKGGTVSKNRSFWFQGKDEKNINFIEKLKNELDFEKNQFLKQGIKHSKFEVDHEIKKIMSQSLSNRLDHKKKQRNSLLNQTTNDSQMNGLKLSLISQGSYFGDEILSTHPLLSQIANTLNSFSSRKLENKNNKGNSSFAIDRNIFSSKPMIESQSKFTSLFQGKDQDQKNSQNNVIQQRQYTVKSKSATCIVLKISMELFLSLTYLNEKYMSASKFLQSDIKQQRRETKVDQHVQLIQASQFMQKKDEIRLKQKSFISDKIIEFIQDNATNSNNIIDSQTKLKDKNETNSSEKELEPMFIFQQKKNSIAISGQKGQNKIDENILQGRKSITETIHGKNDIKQRNSISLSSRKSLLLNESISPNDKKMNDIQSPFDLKKRVSLFFPNNQLQNSKILIDTKRKKNLKFNFGIDDDEYSIHSPVNISSPQKVKNLEEINHLTQTFSSIIEKEHQRQRKVSLMTNTLEKQFKVPFSLIESYKNSPITTPNPVNQYFFGENLSENKLINTQISPTSQVNHTKNYFFRPNYSEAKIQQKSQNEINEYLTNNIIKSNYNENIKDNYKNSFKDRNKTKNHISNPSESTEGNEDLLTSQNSNNSRNSIYNYILDKNKNNSLPLDLFNMSSKTSHRNSFSKVQQFSQQTSLSQASHPSGINLVGGIDYPQSLLKESQNKPKDYQKIIQHAMQSNESINSLNSLNTSRSQNLNLNIKLKELDLEYNNKNLPYLNKEKNSSTIISTGDQNTFVKSKFTEDQRLLTKEDEEEEKQSFKQKSKISMKSDRVQIPLQHAYILKPLFNEIIQKEKEKKQKEDVSEKQERIKIDIFRDFYIKKYRKAYKDIYDKGSKQKNPSFQQLFNKASSQVDQKKQLSEEEYSLLFQKKHLIDKKFPNSDRAQKINDFFKKQVQILDQNHQEEIKQHKRNKLIVAQVSPTQIVKQIDNQLHEHEKDLEFAGKYFNFICKDHIQGDQNNHNIYQTRNSFNININNNFQKKS